VLISDDTRDFILVNRLECSFCHKFRMHMMHRCSFGQGFPKPCSPYGLA